MLEQALILHQSGHLDGAASLYRSILVQNPRHAGAVHLLGVIELQKGNPSAALDLIDSAIAMEPANFTFLSNRAVALQDLKRFGDALVAYDRALAVRPHSPELLNNRGTALREAQRLEEALASYDGALTIKPDYADALNNRGNVLRDMHRFDDALASYGRALAIKPDYFDAISNRASLLQDLARYDEALAGFDHAIRLRPQNAVTHRNRALLLHHLKRHEDAISSYERAIALKPDYPEAYNGLGNVLVEIERMDEAIGRYERALAIKPDYVEAHINLGSVLGTKGDLNAAVSRYRHVLEIAPHCCEAYFGLGDLLIEQGKIDEALRVVQASALLKDEASFSYFSLGVLLAKCRCTEAACDALRTYLKADADDHRGAGLILAGLGGQGMPKHASKAHLQNLYTSRADRWGGSGSRYRGHKLVESVIAQLCAGAAGLDVLDAGCGTGLMGAKLRAMARKLDGVDLTPAMLDRARQSRNYDNLYGADLVEFLADHPNSYDFIGSVATLIHFGDLQPPFAAAAACLRDDGLFVFTLFADDHGRDHCDITVAPLGGLAEGGCYVHTRDYVVRLAKATGFSVAFMDMDVQEYDKGGNPTAGLVVALRRDARN